MTVNFRGYVFNDAGTAVSGADVALLETSTATQESTTTTDSNGLWYFAEADQDRYDVEITSGSSVRRIRWDDQISLMEIDVRNNTAAGTPAGTFTNLTNSASNQVAIFRGANTTRADGDEIYISFELADDGGNLHEFARMTAEATDVSNGSEDGQFRFGVSVAGTITDVFTINSTTGGAAEISYEIDSFTIKGGEGEAGVLYLMADQGDDAGDEWKVNVADGGVLTIENDIASAGSYVAMLTITPHATTASSSVAIAGDATVGDDLSLTSDSSAFNMGAGNDFTITHDGTTGATIAGDPVTITAAGASTWSTSSGALTLTSAAAATWSTAAGALTIDGDDGITLQTTGSGNVTVSEVLDITDATDASDASGDTGALRTEGGASIAKKLYVGTDLDVDGTTNLDNAQIDGTVTVGVNDTGYDVKFFGATSGAYMLWDESTDDLVLAGAANLYFYDAGGGEKISSDGTDFTFNSGNDFVFVAAGNEFKYQVNGEALVRVQDTANSVTTTIIAGITEGSIGTTTDAPFNLLQYGNSRLKITGNGATFQFQQATTLSNSSGDISLEPADDLIVVNGKNLKIGGTADNADVEGTNKLSIFNGTAPEGTLTNGVTLYSKSGDLYALNAAGNETRLTGISHDDH